MYRLMMAATHEVSVSTSKTVTKEEFEAFYNANLDGVFGYLAARVGRFEAEDLTADVFHAAARAAAEGRVEALTPQWAITVARNKVIDHWRRGERRAAKMHLLVTGARGQTLEGPGERVGERERVSSVLNSLSERQRRLLLLYYLDGVSLEELASVVGKSESATESAIYRARLSFKKRYKESEAGDERV